MVRERIASGAWTPCWRLPARGTLARELLGRPGGENIVRRAQELLVEEGLLEARAGSGKYVRAPGARNMISGPMTGMMPNGLRALWTADSASVPRRRRALSPHRLHPARHVDEGTHGGDGLGAQEVTGSTPIMLDAWYQRLRDAYMETMADLGVVSGMEEQAFLEAMAVHKQVDPEMALVLKAIKATAKGGKASCASAPGTRPTSSRGRPWSAKSGAPTSAPPCCRPAGSTCTAR